MQKMRNFFSCRQPVVAEWLCSMEFVTGEKMWGSKIEIISLYLTYLMSLNKPKSVLITEYY
jgi:hypothetical protein